MPTPRKKNRAPRNRTITLTRRERERYARRLLRLSGPASAAGLGGKTVNQDLFQVLDFLPTGFVDLLFIDPPYNLSKDFGATAFKQRTAEEYESWFSSWFVRLLTRKPYRGDRKVISFRAKGYWTVVVLTAGVLAGLCALSQVAIAADKKPPAAPPGMVLVEGGSFRMGDVFGDGKSWQPETPVHEVVVDSFYIGRHEVTFGQFKQFADATGYRTSAEKREGAYSQSPFETHWKLLGYKQAGDEPRILRGGCTGADAKGARVSSRACFGRADHCGNSGFRLARTAPVSGSPSVKTGAVRS